jgi:hypothetical protein
MQSPRTVSDPFALMLDPQAVLQAVEASERLRGLRSRVCRPLDKIGFGHPDAADDAGDGESWVGDDANRRPAADAPGT